MYFIRVDSISCYSEYSRRRRRKYASNDRKKYHDFTHSVLVEFSHWMTDGNISFKCNSTKNRIPGQNGNMTYCFHQPTDDVIVHAMKLVHNRVRNDHHTDKQIQCCQGLYEEMLVVRVLSPGVDGQYGSVPEAAENYINTGQDKKQDRIHSHD